METAHSIPPFSKAGTSGTSGTNRLKPRKTGTTHPIHPLLESGTSGTEGEQILNDMVDLLKEFIYYPNEHAPRVHALWIAHTHMMDAWDATPRLGFFSAIPGSGKSTAFKLTQKLAHRPVTVTDASASAFYRAVNSAGTFLIDEADMFFTETRDTAIFGFLNSGYQRDTGGALRCNTNAGANFETEKLDPFAPVALAGLQTVSLPPALRSRMITINMRKAPAGTVLKSAKARVLIKYCDPIRERLTTWATDAVEQANEAYGELSEASRTAEIWEPLEITAGLVGGSWPQWVKECEQVFAPDPDERSLPVQLMEDIRTLFRGRDEKKTSELVAELISLPETPWGEANRGAPITANWLAKQLKAFGIRSSQFRPTTRPDPHAIRGYRKNMFTKAWATYLDPLPEEVGQDAPQPTGSQDMNQWQDAPTLPIPD